MKLIKHALLSTVLILGLGACARPTIEKGYDDLTKKNYCRLQSLRLDTSWKRNTDLTLEKEGDGIKTIMMTRGFDHRNDFRHNPTLTFDIQKQDQTVEKLQLKTTTVDAKDWYTETYSGPFVIPVHNSSSTSLIPLTKEDFKKIAYADNVHYTLSQGKDSLEGNLNGTDLEFFKQFDQQCLVDK